MSENIVTSKPRGFAALSAEARRELSSRGGKAAHAKGTAHQFSSGEAKAAGALGGRRSHELRRAKMAKAAE